MITFSGARTRRRGQESTLVYAPRSGVACHAAAGPLLPIAVWQQPGMDEEVHRFDEHMKNVRGLAPKTRSMALHAVRLLLLDQFGERPVVISAIKPEDVRRFIRKPRISCTTRRPVQVRWPQPDLAVAEARDRRHAGVDRPSPLTTHRHLGLDIARFAHLDLVHVRAWPRAGAPTIRRRTLPRPRCSRWRPSLLGQRLDPGLYPGEFGSRAPAGSLLATAPDVPIRCLVLDSDQAAAHNASEEMHNLACSPGPQSPVARNK